MGKWPFAAVTGAGSEWQRDVSVEGELAGGMFLSYLFSVKPLIRDSHSLEAEVITFLLS